MSQEEIKSQISQKQNEIAKLEETVVKKELYITNRTNEEFNPHLNEIDVELQLEQSKLVEVNQKIDQWSAKKKRINSYYQRSEEKI